MTLSVEIPDKYAVQLGLDSPGCARRGLEMMALEGYRERKLTRGQVSEMLDQSFNETEAFLLQHGAFIELSAEDYARSSEHLRRFLEQRKPAA